MGLGEAKVPGLFLGGEPAVALRPRPRAFSELVVVWPLPATETMKGLATTGRRSVLRRNAAVLVTGPSTKHKRSSCLIFYLSGLKRCCGYDDRNGLRRERPRAGVERENTTSQIVYKPNLETGLRWQLSKIFLFRFSCFGFFPCCASGVGGR